MPGDLSSKSNNEPQTSSAASFALAYAARGYFVFPCRADKKPYTKHGFKDASTDPAVVRAFWTDYADAQVGIDCERSGIVVVDLDKKNGEDGIAAFEVLRGSEPHDCSLVVSSPSGGRHFVYQAIDGVEIKSTAGQVAPGIDTRACGGYVIAPSPASLGRTCIAGEWLDMTAEQLAPPPAWLRALLPRCNDARRDRSQILTLVKSADTEASTQRRSRLDSYVRAAIDNETAKVSGSTEGNRNDTLNKAAFALGQLVGGGHLDREVVRAALLGAAISAGLPESEARATITSGLDAGSEHPRDLRHLFEGQDAAPEQESHRDGTTPSPHESTKPTVLIPGEHKGVRVGNDEFVTHVVKALPEGVLYRRGQVLGELVREQGKVKFIQASEHRMRAIVDAHAQLVYWQWNRSTKVHELRYEPCSRDLACVFLASAPQATNLRELRAIVRYPVFTSDFSLVQAGWNEKDGIYYDEPDELAGLQPCKESPLDILTDLTVDFPFKNRASQENAFGLMLTAFCAHAIRGNIPLHLVHSSLERTGKGLLIDVVLGVVFLGEDCVPTMQIGRTEDEREKRITSAIIEGATIVHIDNLPSEEVLDSPSLASLATSRTWRGRVLGFSRLIELLNTLIPVFSGNNPKATGELTKRTVPIALQPKDDKPEERRDFVHPDVRGYARDRRRTVLGVLMRMVQDWVDAGCPPPPTNVRMGGFEDFVRVVGGILHYAGATAWLSNYAAWIKCGDEFSADAAVLVDHWWRVRGSAEVAPADILDMVKKLGVFPQVVAGQESGASARLARQVLSPLEDRPVAGRFVRRRAFGNASRYWLSEVKS